MSIARPVAAALRSGGPIVALESTLVTHGFPASQGLEVARELESLVREGGATPATVGVLEGRPVVGLTADELARLAAIPDVVKLNLSNLAAACSGRVSGSTTVAATMWLAHRAGVRVFATGGIGGVHRHAEVTGDISADLTALARFPVAVVCAGAKAILDLPRTVEALETLGVPILGFRTNRFPAFYRRDSGLAVDWQLDSIEELAATIDSHFRLGPGGGVIVALPIEESEEMPEDLYESILEQVLSEASVAEIRGRALTPFLLTRMHELSFGQSTFSNRALLAANARLAASLAVELGRRQLTK